MSLLEFYMHTIVRGELVQRSGNESLWNCSLNALPVAHQRRSPGVAEGRGCKQATASGVTQNMRFLNDVWDNDFVHMHLVEPQAFIGSNKSVSSVTICSFVWQTLPQIKEDNIASESTQVSSNLWIFFNWKINMHSSLCRPVWHNAMWRNINQKSKAL